MGHTMSLTSQQHFPNFDQDLIRDHSPLVNARHYSRCNDFLIHAAKMPYPSDFVQLKYQNFKQEISSKNCSRYSTLTMIQEDLCKVTNKSGIAPILRSRVFLSNYIVHFPQAFLSSVIGVRLDSSHVHAQVGYSWRSQGCTSS